jgi:hypothetical protein
MPCFRRWLRFFGFVTDGLFRSSDNGETWEPNNFYSFDVVSMRVVGTTIYALVNGLGL